VISVQGVTGVDTTYSGVSGALEYLEDLSNTRNASLTVLGDLQFTWNDDGSVTVTAAYQGYETVWPAGTSDTFLGTRTFTVVRSNQQWLISSLTRARLVTLPAADAQEEVAELLVEWVGFGDAVALLTSSAEVVSAYGSLVGDYFTDDAVITLSGLSGVSGTYNGVSGALQYLEDLSSTRSASVTVLSDFQFTWNADGSASVTVPYTGYETVIPAGTSDVFFGTRSFTVVRSNQQWLISSLTRVRAVTIDVSNLKK